MYSDLKAVVLAAGKGTRLQSESCHLPKVMRLAHGQPLLAYVLDGLSFLPQENIILVVGYRKEDVLTAYPTFPFVEQTEQLGTGHAVRSAATVLDGFQGDLLVCCGDMPLMKQTTYEALVHTHQEQKNDCTILTGIANEPLPYGRVIRDHNGNFLRIVEDKDCSVKEKAITELNAGVYLFRWTALQEALDALRPDNTQGEYYLTDAPAYILARGGKVSACPACTPLEMLGVNTPEQLAQVEAILSQQQA